MSESWDHQRVLVGVGDDGAAAGISLQADLDPLGGPGAPVKPAVYEGGSYQLDRRWWRDGDVPVDAVVIDNTPSQANRSEAALDRLRDVLGLPALILDLTSVGTLPPHVPTELTSFQFPHRHADAYLRDSLLAETGEKFTDSEIGRALIAASAQRPAALLQWVPQSLLYGFWLSHQGKRGAQTKFARAVEAEIVGYQPASVDTRRLGLKGDPLNLSIDSAVRYDENDLTTWELTSGAKAGASKSKDSLAEIGHGQVPFKRSDAALGAVSCRAIEQRCTISFARLRNVDTGDPATSAAARAVLVSLALVAIEGAFGQGFALRSGCDLRPVRRTFTWRGASGDQEMAPLGLEEAVALLASSTEHAARLGLPVGPAWASDPVRLVPNPNLAKVIRSTFALEG